VGELGDLLRRSRQQLNLTLDDIQAATHIQRRYLEALEDEHFDNLPDRVVGRGFLRNYAAALKLDPGFLVDLFEGVTQPPRFVPDSPTVTPKGILYKDISMTSPSRTSTDIVTGVLVALVLVGGLLGVFYVFRDRWLPLVNEIAEQPPLPTSDAAFLLPTPTPLPTYTPTPTSTSTPQYYTGVTIELRISEESWVQVLVDGAKVFESIMRPGDENNWTGERQVAVRVGNAGGVEAIVNGESVGMMGERGQVVDQVWEKVETGSPILLTPTPTAAAAIGNG
jgi:cytoskeletal protein RodZ